MTNKIILTDCDGVLMDWERSFHAWMIKRGYKMEPEGLNHYCLNKRYGISNQEQLIRQFNESAAIGSLGPFRDAMYYVDLLHRKCGYVFHMISSLSADPYAQELRIRNTKKLFGETAFERFVFTDLGESKKEILQQYKSTGYIWIDDLPEHVEDGLSVGLDSFIMHHNYNKQEKRFNRIRSWSEIFNGEMD